MRQACPRGNDARSALCLAALVSWLPAAGCDEGRSFLSTPGSTHRRGAVENVRVRRAVDGDTVVLADGRRVRYLGLDAPEPEAPFHAVATEQNRQLVEGRSAELEIPRGEETDRYGRLLGVLYTEENSRLCVNIELVRSGYAWVYRKGPDSIPPGLLEQLLDAQSEALRRRSGIWSQLDARERKGQAPIVSTRFRLHRASCRHLRDARPRPVVSLEGELQSGKSPCRTCRPLW